MNGVGRRRPSEIVSKIRQTEANTLLLDEINFVTYYRYRYRYRCRRRRRYFKKKSE